MDSDYDCDYAGGCSDCFESDDNEDVNYTSDHGGELEGEENYMSNDEGEEEDGFHVQVEGEEVSDDDDYEGEELEGEEDYMSNDEVEEDDGFHVQVEGEEDSDDDDYEGEELEGEEDYMSSDEGEEDDGFHVQVEGEEESDDDDYEGEGIASDHGSELEGEEDYMSNEGEEDDGFHVQVEGEEDSDGESEVPIEDDEDHVNNVDGVRAGFDYEDESEEEVWRIPPVRTREIDQASVARTQAVLLEDSLEAISHPNNDVDIGSQEPRREVNQARPSGTLQNVRDSDGSNGVTEVGKKGDAGKASSSDGGNGSRSETDGFSCSICMEPWTTDAEHYVCCLPCGHLYGMSCIRSWLLQPNSGKCPQCNKACNPEDIRRIYGLTTRTMDKESQEMIRLLETKCASLELKDSEWKRKETEWRLKEALMRL